MKIVKIIGIGIIGIIILSIVGYAISNQDPNSNRQKLTIDNLKYNKDSQELTGNVHLYGNVNVNINFYDDKGYLGNTSIISSLVPSFNTPNIIFFRIHVSRNPIGKLNVVNIHEHDT